MTKASRMPASGAGYAGRPAQGALRWSWICKRATWTTSATSAWLSAPSPSGQPGQAEGPVQGVQRPAGAPRMERALPLCWKHQGGSSSPTWAPPTPRPLLPEVRGRSPTGTAWRRHEDRLRHRRRPAARHRQVHGHRGVGDPRTPVQAPRRDRLRQRLHGAWRVLLEKPWSRAPTWSSPDA